jgi:hypothetical protein
MLGTEQASEERSGKTAVVLCLGKTFGEMFHPSRLLEGRLRQMSDDWRGKVKRKQSR